MNRLKTVTVANIRKLEDHEPLEIGDFLKFLTLEEYEEAEEEITDINKKFAGKMVEVLEKSIVTDEFGEFDLLVQDADDNIVLAKSRDFSEAYREITK